MTDTVEIVTTTNNLELPKQTTADDLLSMYEDEASENTNGEAKPVTKATTGEESKTTTEPPKDADIIEAKSGESKIAIPKDAKFSIEVDGKSIEITQNDAIKAFQKQREFDGQMAKRFNDAHRKEQSVDNAKQNLITIATRVASLTESGDMLGANRELAKIASKGTQLDIVEWERKFFDQNEAFYKAYTALTPDQKDRFFKDRKGQLLEEELKGIKERDAKNAQLGSLDQQVKTLQTQYEIPNDEFWETYKLVVDELTGEGEGKIFKSADDIKPEDVVEQTLLNRRVSKIYEAAKSVSLDREDVIDELIATSGNKNDWTAEQFAETIRMSGLLENASPESVENLNRRAKKNGSQPKSAISTKKESKTEGLDKEDLDFLYRKQPKVVKSINYR